MTTILFDSAKYIPPQYQ